MAGDRSSRNSQSTSKHKSTAKGKLKVAKSVDKVIDKDKDDVKCPDCQIKVQEEDDALTCDICSNWYHIACQNVPEQVYEYFAGGNDATSQLHWYCKACNVGATNLIHMLNNTRDKLDKQIKEVDKKVNVMDMRVTDNKQTSDENKQKIDEIMKKIADIPTTKGDHSKIEKTIQVMKDEDSRKANIIVYNSIQFISHNKRTKSSKELVRTVNTR